MWGPSAQALRVAEPEGSSVDARGVGEISIRRWNACRPARKAAELTRSADNTSRS